MIKFDIRTEDRIVVINYSGIISKRDLARFLREAKPQWAKFNDQNGYGVVADFRNVEILEPDAQDYLKETIIDRSNVDQKVRAIVFTDRFNPALQFFQEQSVRARIHSAYFTDFDKAYYYVKEYLEKS